MIVMLWMLILIAIRKTTRTKKTNLDANDNVYDQDDESHYNYGNRDNYDYDDNDNNYHDNHHDDDYDKQMMMILMMTIRIFHRVYKFIMLLFSLTRPYVDLVQYLYVLPRSTTYKQCKTTAKQIK